MKHWLQDQHFRSLLKNTSYLGISKAVAAVGSLAALALAGRGLGLTQFGILVLIASYVQAASGLSKFQSWQLIIRYGSPALVRGDVDEFKGAAGFALGLDLASGLFGMALAIALLPLIGGWFGISDEHVSLAMLYCAIIPSMGAATPVGVLRALDRFDLLSWQGTVTPIARALFTAVAWAQDAPFAAYVAIWILTQLAGDLFLWFLALRELRRRHMLQGIYPVLRPRNLPGAWKFALSVNLMVSLNTAMGPIARLLVGGLLGPASAALFRVASSLAESAGKPADLLGKAFYPEIARMDPASKKPWKLMVRGMFLSMLIGSAVMIVILLIGPWLLETLFGEEFLPAYPVLAVLMLGTLLGLVSFPLPSMLYTLDRANDPLVARLLGTVAFLIAVWPLSRLWDVVGAGVAFVINMAVMVAVMALQLFAHRRRMRRS